MSKHTPGPWMVRDGKIVEKIYNGFTIADVRGATEVDGYEADARLIAAAPELLSIVKKLAYNEGMVGEESFRKQMWGEMMAIIAKAEGEE